MSKPRPTVGIDSALHGFLRKAGLEDALLQHAAWERAAGELLARHVRPVGRKNGALMLEADTLHWQKQALGMKARLLPRVQAEGLDVLRLVIKLSPDAPPK
ncbi:MAG: DUF721 domain-containing protein [Deltaproteobacteria bacterium]|nr:DUF721 domain-containing protein [Deltaproteobacteria bacterium]